MSSHLPACSEGECPPRYHKTFGTCEADDAGSDAADGGGRDQHRCGDGIIDRELDEVCDDGPANSDRERDACRTNCELPTCGDDVVDTGEACDDGEANSDDPDAVCRTSCVLASCGDGVADPGEQCDDGTANNDEQPNACRTSCLLAFCGDHVIDAGEACDDGFENSDVLADACRLSCASAECGDGVIDSTEICDDGDLNSDALPDACRTSCSPPSCGDGTVDSTETCDDGNFLESDGCDSDCQPTRITALVAGGAHSCALLRGGYVRCWGDGGRGQLGSDDFSDRGDEDGEMPPPSLDVGGQAEMLAAGAYHTCALLDSGAIRCWGAGESGQLGNGSTGDIGDEAGEMADLEDIPLGRAAVSIAAGASFTCALLAADEIKCWGAGAYGKLGNGDTVNLGDAQGEIEDLNGIEVAGTPSAITTGFTHACTLLDSGNVSCWGEGTYGRLGNGSATDVGDSLGGMPAPFAGLGETVDSVAAGGWHTCVLQGGAVRCWGYGGVGALGQDDISNIGDAPGEVGALDAIEAGAEVAAIVPGGFHTCALLMDGDVRCWGSNGHGQLGDGNEGAIGDEPGEMAALGSVEVGGMVEAIAAGAYHTCALLNTGRARCWGDGADGRLGYGGTENVGDDEAPESVGDVPVF